MIFMLLVLTILIVSVHSAEGVSSEQLCSQTVFTTPKATQIDLSSQEPK